MYMGNGIDDEESLFWKLNVFKSKVIIIDS